MERKELAIQLYKKGYSCAQAVACAYHDIMGIPVEHAVPWSWLPAAKLVRV